MSSAGATLRIRDETFHHPGRYFHNLPDSGSNNDSILIYLAIGGSVIPMHVSESDSIASVKLRIQTCKGFVVRKQKLVYEGRELARNNSLVRDYGVTDGNVLHLVLRLSELQVITVRTVCGKEFEFQVEKCRNVGYVKQQLMAVSVVDNDQELECNGEKLDDDRVLVEDICKDFNDAVIHILVRKSSAKVRALKPVDKNFELSIVASGVDECKDNAALVVEKPQEKNAELLVVDERKDVSRDFLEPIIVNPEIGLSSVIKDMIHSTVVGLEKGKQPVRSSEGSGGAYFMQDPLGDKYVSVFKPMDEEPMAANNPHGLPLSLDGEGLKKGTRVGEGAVREVAAYILDHPRGGPRSFGSNELGFAGVPPTAMVRCLHKGFNYSESHQYAAQNFKIGSLQMFMSNNGSCEDMGPGAFPLEEVHKISVLDMRLANADRHAGNILLSKDEESRTVLIPIDHGYCLPENFEDCTFDWLYWPQAKKPYARETINYIRSLDAEADIALLKYHGWNVPLKCARTLRISTMLLKKGAERGFTPFTIGRIMCRETLKKESVIEEIVCEAQDSVLPGTSETTFLECVSQIMDRRLEL